MRIYHGSNVVVNRPEILEEQRMLDFGKGFYTTKNEEQAQRWAQKVSARRNSNKGCISAYEFDYENASKELDIIRFETADEKWLEFVCSCRKGEDFPKNYDMVFGPVADDNVYETVQLYELGVLKTAEALERLKIEKLYNQILFHSEKSLNYCSYIESYEIGVEENE